MDSTNKGQRWRSYEIVALLHIIKNKNIIQLMDGKVKRNKKIYEEIELELKKDGIEKSFNQIRTKFKAMKSDYLKTKRHNAISGNSRQECDHFELLEEIFQSRPLASVSGMDTATDWSMNSEFLEIMEPTVSPPSSTPSPTAVTALPATSPIVTPSQSESASSNEIPSTSEAASSSATPSVSAEPSASATPSLRSFRNTRKFFLF